MTLSITSTETLKWLSSLPILMQESFGGDTVAIGVYNLPLPPPPYPLPPFSPSLISPMVSVDAKHHDYYYYYLLLGIMPFFVVRSSHNIFLQQLNYTLSVIKNLKQECHCRSDMLLNIDTKQHSKTAQPADTYPSS